MIGKTNAILIGDASVITGDHLVRFYDFNGNLLKEEWVNNGDDASPPETPEHDFLTFDEWNQPYTNITRARDIGATYKTTNENTIFVCDFDNKTGLHPELRIATTSNALLTIIWGDGEITTSNTNGDLTLIKPSPYAASGRYVIEINCSNNYNNSNSGANFFNNTLCGYGVKKYFIGKNHSTTWSDGSWDKMFYIEELMLPKTFTYARSFAKFYNLKGIVYPNGNTSSKNSQSLPKLEVISIPDTITSITSIMNFLPKIKRFIFPNNCSTFSPSLSNCVNCEEIYLPSNITSLPASIMQNWYSLKKMVYGNLINSAGNYSLTFSQVNEISLPNLSVLPNYCFQNNPKLETFIYSNTVSNGEIGIQCFLNNALMKNFTPPSNTTVVKNSAFSGCISIPELDFPSSLITIENAAFSGMLSCLKYIFRSITPPTLSSTSAFSSIRPEAKIYVPDSSVDAYKTATNWSTYANYIYPLSDLE